MLKLMVMFQQALRPVKNQKGAVAIEYALLAVLIALAIVGGASALGTKLSDFFQAIATALPGTVTLPSGT